jgi:integrase
MARTTKPLTNTEVKQAKPKEKVYSLSDGSGLQLRVKPNGSKNWLLDYYRPHTKKRTSLSLGSYPEVSLADARVKRADARELLVQDIDPKEHRDKIARQNKAAHENTFKLVANQHHQIKKTTVSADHAKDIWRSFELHLFTKLGDVPIHKIDAPSVIEVLKPVSARSLETTKRLCQRINEIMVFAVNTGLIHHNPLAGISKAFEAPEKKNMPTIPPDELPNLMKQLSLASIKLTTRCLIEWQLHTMVRPSEAAGTMWKEIDTEQKLWTIPPDRMKKKKAHVVPLTPQTLALLDLMRVRSGTSDYVFPGDRNTKKASHSSTANMALKRMGFHGKLVAHGLRALASTTLNEQGFDPDVIEACLAHVDKNEVRAAYNRADYIERRKKVMTWWSDHIEKAATTSTSLGNTASGYHIRTA